MSIGRLRACLFELHCAMSIQLCKDSQVLTLLPFLSACSVMAYSPLAMGRLTGKYSSTKKPQVG